MTFYDELVHGSYERHAKGLEQEDDRRRAIEEDRARLEDSSGDKPIVASAAARTHELKTVQPHYDNVVSGKKTVDVRRDDRGFAEGDILVLREYDAATASYSGRSHVVEVTHVLNGFEGLTPGWVAMSIRTRR